MLIPSNLHIPIIKVIFMPWLYNVSISEKCQEAIVCVAYPDIIFKCSAPSETGLSKISFLKFVLYNFVAPYSLILGSTKSYSIPAKVLRMASKIILAPSHGTAIPICFLTLSRPPSKT